MLRSEFEIITGMYPSETLYSVIEKHYNESKADKHDFCRAYMMNADSIASRIQHECNELELNRENECAVRIAEADSRVNALQKAIEKLQKELDRELDWKPAEYAGTNMNQTDYGNLFTSCGTNRLDDEQAKEMISSEFGFMPERIRIIFDVKTFEVNKYHRLRAKDFYLREPVYNASDWNYIRFDCAGSQWEMVNGELLPYED